MTTRCCSSTRSSAIRPFRSPTITRLFMLPRQKPAEPKSSGKVPSTISRAAAKPIRKSWKCSTGPTKPGWTISKPWQKRNDRSGLPGSTRWHRALMNIAFVGGGNMARALIGGLLQRGFGAGAISVVEIDSAARSQLSSLYSVGVTEKIGSEVESSDVVLLAVKPQQMSAVAVQLRGALRTQLVVSIAAGVRTTDLSRWLG